MHRLNDVHRGRRVGARFGERWTNLGSTTGCKVNWVAVVKDSPIDAEIQ